MWMSPVIASCRHIHIPSNSNFAIVFEDPITDLQQWFAIVDTHVSIYPAATVNCNCSFLCIPHEFMIVGFFKVATANHLQLPLFRQELKTILLNICSIRPTQIHKPTWNPVITTLEKLNTSHIQGTKLPFTQKKVSFYFSQSIVLPSGLQLSLCFQIWD